MSERTPTVVALLESRMSRELARLGLHKELVKALNRDVTVAAVGPTCAAVLEAHGVDVDVTPDHPKMGALVLALMHHLEHSRASSKRISVSSVVASENRTWSAYPLRDRER